MTWARLRLALLLLLVAGVRAAPGLVLCPDDRYRMPSGTALPWGAIGFINNGCSGTLIDGQHVLAAAHCFVNDVTGEWQTGLRFYPNFPQRALTQTGYDIDRAVVGTRVETGGDGPEYQASDWGIGHLSTPVTGYPSMGILPIESFPAPVVSAGYPRDPKYFSPQPAPPGESCQMTFPASPDACFGFAGSHCWWIPALVDPSCTIFGKPNNELAFDCASLPGNSGSPIFRQLSDGSYRIAGVIHGGASQCPADPCVTGKASGVNSGPAAQRFVSAPRFASDVALARASGVARLWAADADAGVVVTRGRTGTAPSSPFGTFDPWPGQALPRRITAFTGPGKRARVLASRESGSLYVWASVDKDDGAWISYELLPPPSVGAVRDLDAVYTTNKTDDVYLVNTAGQAWRLRLNDPTKNAAEWTSLPPVSAHYTRVAAVRWPFGTEQVFLVTDSGVVVTRTRKGKGWSPFLLAGGPPSTGRIVDLDAAYDVKGRVQMVAVDDQGQLWIRRAKTAVSKGWMPWEEWTTQLYAPRAASPQPPPFRIVSLTASHLDEVIPGSFGTKKKTRRPIVFAVDHAGNIYYTTQTCGSGKTCTPAWDAWRSFYH